MPTIEITPDQADAIALGETITIGPKPKYYVAVHKDGAVYLIRGPVKKAEWRMLQGDHASSPREPWTQWQTYRHDFTKSENFTVVPIEAR